jgi:hypothetical protein
LHPAREADKCQHLTGIRFSQTQETCLHRRERSRRGGSEHQAELAQIESGDRGDRLSALALFYDDVDRPESLDRALHDPLDILRFTNVTHNRQSLRADTVDRGDCRVYVPRWRASGTSVFARRAIFAPFRAAAKAIASLTRRLPPEMSSVRPS